MRPPGVCQRTKQTEPAAAEDGKLLCVQPLNTQQHKGLTL